MHTPVSITPKPREALQAMQANGGTVKRGRGGFIAPTTVITRRTANHLVEHGLAQFDNADFPSQLRLTSAGARIAAEVAAPKVKAGVA